MKYNILIVESNQFMADKMEAGISGLDMEYKIFAAKSFNEAHIIMESATIDIFMVDILLSDDFEKGQDFVKEIREIYPYNPIIIFSADLVIEQQIKIFSELNVFAYINKPFQNFEIVDHTKKALLLAEILYNRRVTFRRNNFTKIYRTRDICCIHRVQNGQKRIAVIALDEITRKLSTEDFPIKSSLNEVLDLFENGCDILRCHQSWFVNPHYIRGFDALQSEIILTHNIRVPVGESYKKIVSLFI